MRCRLLATEVTRTATKNGEHPLFEEREVTVILNGYARVENPHFIVRLKLQVVFGGVVRVAREEVSVTKLR